MEYMLLKYLGQTPYVGAIVFGMYSKRKLLDS
jgi:hypothetical protein